MRKLNQSQTKRELCLHMFWLEHHKKQELVSTWRLAWNMILSEQTLISETSNRSQTEIEMFFEMEILLDLCKEKSSWVLLIAGHRTTGRSINQLLLFGWAPSKIINRLPIPTCWVAIEAGTGVKGHAGQKNKLAEGKQLTTLQDQK